jgi:TolB-like protein/Flp pilus assembly protein TadD
MPHDVFISYATKDKQIADAVCAAVEARGFRCWIAPRDVRAGMPYGEAIIDAIQGSRVMVVVFSSNANASTHIPKEVECATTDGVTIIPFRVENVVPTKSLNYFLASLHWLDALTTPLEPHLQRLTEAVERTVKNGTEGARSASEEGRDSSLRGRTSRQSPGEERSSAQSAQNDSSRAAASGYSIRNNTGGNEVARSWWRGKAAVGIAVVVLLALLGGAAWSYRSRFGGGETIDSLAVLPFVNGSGDPSKEYLSDGIAESLISGLSQLPHLKVMSRDSVFRYKGKDTDAETAGRELGVRAIFKGRVTQLGDNNLDISTELIDARDNTQIWGQQYSRKASDIFALQNDIAKEITSALRTRLSGDDEKRLAKSYTTNPEAYQDYLKGHYWGTKGTEEGLNKGIEYFEQAIDKDPTYALAYSGLANTYTAIADFGFIPHKEALPKAEEAARKAVELDGSLAEAHASLAWVKSVNDLDWSGGESEFQRAIALNPNYPTSHFYHGLALAVTGRLDEAIAETKRTLELDPLSLVTNSLLGESYYFARRDDQAIEQLQKTLELDPNFLLAQDTLGHAYVQKSMYKEGIAEFQKALAIFPRNAVALSGLGYAYAVSGRRAEGEKVLDQLTEISKQKYVPAVSRAAIYAGLGDKDKAFEWLGKAYEERSIVIGGGHPIKVDPVWDPLRADPRFADLVRRMNLTP